MKPFQLIPAMYFFLQNIVIFYDKTRAEQHKYNNLQHCIDRLASFEKAVINEHARLILSDRRIFQTLLPHMGHPEYARLNKILSEILDGCRSLSFSSAPHNS